MSQFTTEQIINAHTQAPKKIEEFLFKLNIGDDLTRIFNYHNINPDDRLAIENELSYTLIGLRSVADFADACVANTEGDENAIYDTCDDILVNLIDDLEPELKQYPVNRTVAGVAMPAQTETSNQIIAPKDVSLKSIMNSLDVDENDLAAVNKINGVGDFGGPANSGNQGISRKDILSEIEDPTTASTPEFIIPNSKPRTDDILKNISETPTINTSQKTSPETIQTIGQGQTQGNNTNNMAQNNANLDLDNIVDPFKTPASTVQTMQTKMDSKISDVTVNKNQQNFSNLKQPNTPPKSDPYREAVL